MAESVFMNFLATTEEDLQIRSDGIDLAAKLSISSDKAPLVVFVHGFAGDKNEGGLFQEAAAYFQSHGFSVLRFDFRGCGESSGVSFRRVRLKDLQGDLKNVFQFIRSHKELYPCALGVVGFSLGAAVAILCNPRRVKAHVYWSPAIFTANDMYPRYRNWEVQREIKEKGFFIKAGLEVSPEFIEDLQQNQIEFSIRDVKASVLLLHGGLDRRIPESSSRQAAKLFRHAQFRSLPGADHAFKEGGQITRKLLFSASLNWFEKHLLGETADKPVHDSRDLFEHSYI